MHRILLALSLFVCATSFAQAPDTLWTRTYGGDSGDECNSVQQTADGGYILTGTTHSFSESAFEFWLIKVNANGDSVWSKTYRESAHESCNSGQQTIDGGYVLAGWANYGQQNGHHDFYFIKTNENGDSLWSRRFGSGGSNQDQCYDVQQSSDGGYVLVGEGHIDDDFWLVKTDEDGDSLWSENFGGSSSEVCYSIQQTTDSGYILGGYTASFGAGGRDFWLVKLSANGDSLWSRTFGSNGDEECRSVQQTFDGGYVLGGFTGSFGNDQEFYIVKTDEFGIEEWSHTYGGINSDYGFALQATTDGYLLAGSTGSFGNGSYDFWVIKTDTNGDSVWSKALGGNGVDQCFAIEQTNDNGYILAGITNSFGSGDWDFHLIRLDREPCPPTPLPFLDDFSSPELDSCWFWVREDTSHWSLTDRPGWMRIETQGGTDASENCCMANNLLRRISNQDFSLTTHVQIGTIANCVQAGFEVYRDEDNYIQAGISYAEGNGRIAFIAKEEDGIYQSAIVTSYSDPAYVMLRKRDNLYTAFASMDSVGWDSVGSFEIDLQIDGNLSVGLQAHDGCGSVEIPAEFEFFRIDGTEPQLFVSPASFDFGIIDFGSDPSDTLNLTNPGGIATEILAMNLQSTNFAFDSSGLNGQVNANSTYDLAVTFTPEDLGFYEDTLVIVAQRAGNDTIQIPLSGTAEILLPAPDSLVISWQTGNNLQLDWPPITHTISGQPFTPPSYSIYASNTVNGAYTFVASTPTNSWTNPFFFAILDMYFFRVVAETE